MPPNLTVAGKDLDSWTDSSDEEKLKGDAAGIPSEHRTVPPEKGEVAISLGNLTGEYAN
jgi:hypothetical protein